MRSHLKHVAEGELLPYAAEGGEVGRRAIGDGRLISMDQSVDVLLVRRNLQRPRHASNFEPGVLFSAEDRTYGFQGASITSMSFDIRRLSSSEARVHHSLQDLADTCSRETGTDAGAARSPPRRTHRPCASRRKPTRSQPCLPMCRSASTARSAQLRCAVRVAKERRRIGGVRGVQAEQLGVARHHRLHSAEGAAAGHRNRPLAGALFGRLALRHGVRGLGRLSDHIHTERICGCAMVRLTACTDPRCRGPGSRQPFRSY